MRPGWPKSPDGGCTATDFSNTGEILRLLVFVFNSICFLSAPWWFLAMTGDKNICRSRHSKLWLVLKLKKPTLKNLFLFESRPKLHSPFSGKFRPKKQLKQLMKFPSAGIFLGETIIKLSKMSLQGLQKETALREFKLCYPQGSSSPAAPCEAKSCPWNPSSPASPGWWVAAARIFELMVPVWETQSLFRPLGFWWLLSLAERAGERLSW